MATKITTLEDRGILEVVYSADPVTPEDLAAQRNQVADAIRRSNIARVLLNASALARFPSPLTAIEHNKDIAANDILRRAKFAVLRSSLGKDERCLENTGVNRGVNMKCFTSREEALAWPAG